MKRRVWPSHPVANPRNTRVDVPMQVAFHLCHRSAGLRVSSVRKVRAGHLTVMVCAEPADVSDIDQRLWTLTPHAFLAHAAHGASPEVWARSAVVLCTEPPPGESRHVELRSLPDATVLSGLSKLLPPTNLAGCRATALAQLCGSRVDARAP